MIFLRRSERFFERQRDSYSIIKVSYVTGISHDDMLFFSLPLAVNGTLTKYSVIASVNLSLSHEVKRVMARIRLQQSFLF